MRDLNITVRRIAVRGLVSMRLLLTRRDRALVQMSSSTIGSQVSIVNGRMKRNWSCRTNVLVRVLEDELLKLGCLPFTLVEDALVVYRARSTLYGDVRAHVEIELEWVSASGFDKSSGEGITVSIALASFREETNVVTLSSNHDGELGHSATQLAEVSLHIAHLFFYYGSILTPESCQHISQTIVEGRPAQKHHHEYKGRAQVPDLGQDAASSSWPWGQSDPGYWMK